MNPVRNHRFWIWWRDGWVKLTVRPHESLTAARFSHHDEGWSSCSETFTHSPDGVFSTEVHDGRDCDGRLTLTYRRFAKCEDLAKIPAAPKLGSEDNPIHPPSDYHDGGLIHRPEWKPTKAAEVFDEYAQA